MVSPVCAMVDCAQSTDIWLIALNLLKALVDCAQLIAILIVGGTGEVRFLYFLSFIPEHHRGFSINPIIIPIKTHSQIRITRKF